MEGYNALALGVAAFITGLFLGMMGEKRRRFPNGKLNYLIDLNIENAKNTQIIMATIAELTTKLDELQSTVDAEQEQIAAAIAALQATIDELRANQNDPAAIDAAIAKVDSVIADLKSTVPDEETPGEEPVV